MDSHTNLGFCLAKIVDSHDVCSPEINPPGISTAHPSLSIRLRLRIYGA